MSDIKTITCPHCGNPKCYDTDEFCFNCGSIIINGCDNPECPGLDTGEHPRGFFELPENYCFCPRCGSPTRFYGSGLRKPVAY